MSWAGPGGLLGGPEPGDDAGGGMVDPESGGTELGCGGAELA